MEGLENEEGGEERKIRGEEMVLLLCQGMPLTEIGGVLFKCPWTFLNLGTYG